MRLRRSILSLLLLSFLMLPAELRAQDDLAALMEVISPGVEVQRVGTATWLPVSVEAIVGVGDTIRTDSTGNARIIFFADGTDTELLPDTEYRIDQFQGEANSFSLQVSVLAGNTVQRLNNLADTDSEYKVDTPGMELVARGTAFAIRVEADGRAAMLVSEGLVGANKEDNSAEVPPQFGIRSPVEGQLSDVVRADNFAELDSALDGCAVELNFQGDIRLNVRLGPSLDFARVGTVAPGEIDNLIGINQTGDWYRIAFRGGFGWLQVGDLLNVNEGCAGFRVFEDTFGPEDPSLYENLGDEIELPDDLTPETNSTSDTDAEAAPDTETQTEGESAP